MTNRIADLRKPALPNGPAIGNLEFHTPAKAHHVHQMAVAQDQPLGVGRRVVASCGMRGRPSFDVDFMDVGLGASAERLLSVAAPTTARLVHETNYASITPGHALRIEARCLPSGPTGNTITVESADAVDVGGDDGAIKVEVTWINGATTETITSTLGFPADSTDYGHGPDIHGMGFTQLQDKWTTNFPSSAFFDSDDLVTYTGGGVGQCSAHIKIYYVGGVRPVEVVVHEVPYKVARAEGIPAAPAHIYQQNNQIIQAFPYEYPVEGATSGDRRFGANYMLDVMKEHGRRLGPAILTLDSHRGGVPTEGTGGPAPWEITSTSLTSLTGETYDISTGTFGRRFTDSSPTYAMADTGVVHLLVGVYWKVSAGTGTLRVKTADHSYAETTTTSTSYGWSLFDCHLECGATVLDQKQLEILASQSSGTMSVRYIEVYYFPQG